MMLKRIPTLFWILLFVAFYLYVIMAVMPYRQFILSRQEDRKGLLHHEEYRLLADLKATENLPADDPKRAKIQHELGLIYWQLKKTPEPETFLKLALASAKSHATSGYDETYVSYLLDLAGLYRDLGRFYESEQLYKELLAYDEKNSQPNSVKIARDYSNLGLVGYLSALATEDKTARKYIYEEAITNLDKAIACYRATLGFDSQNEGNALATKALVLRDMGQVQKGEEARAESARIRALVKTPCTPP